MQVNITSKAKAHIDKDKRLNIQQLEIVKGRMNFGKSSVETLRFICHAPYVRKDNSIDICMNPMKTVVGGGTGDQTEIIECGKCRSQYIIRTQYSDLGHVNFSTSIWDVGRKLKAMGRFMSAHDDYKGCIDFGKDVEYVIQN